MDLASYDRFFPSQDFTPRGGFGNLIALPLQKKCRPLGNSEFIDTTDSEIKDQPSGDELLIIATGQYLGEGFDCPQIDTLFLAFPIAFRGKLIQYVGRILRKHECKTSVIVYDYLDKQVPVLNAMFFRRAKAYKTMEFLI